MQFHPQIGASAPGSDFSGLAGAGSRLTDAAPDSGPVARNENAQTGANGWASKQTLEQVTRTDCEGAAIKAQYPKQIATWRAKLALAGWVLEVHEDRFVISRWGKFREISCEDALCRFMRQVGVQP